MSAVNVTSIDSATLASHINGSSGKKIVLVDVRSEGEFAAGHISGAVNLPATELDLHPDHVAKFVNDHVPAATEVVFYGLDNSIRAPEVAQAIHSLIETHEEYSTPPQYILDHGIAGFKDAGFSSLIQGSIAARANRRRTD